LIGKLLNEDPPKLRSVRRELPEWLCTAVDGALQRDPDVRWQSARTMAETLRLKGRGEIELDWELHEDATVRTNSPYDSGESARPPALAMISVPDEPTVDVSGMQADSVEVDLEQLEPETLEESSPFDASIFDSAGGATIKSDVPPPHVLDAILAARGKPAKSRLWTGVLLGVVITLLAAAAAGWFVYERYLLPEAAPPVETPPAPVG
ncbi:MAG TPA: hypothetical protein DEF51_35950, partial [Myxococcales bacterium]|nr:hypothetical protein [Myxococcales bacterium]